MGDGAWMFGMSNEARANIYAERHRKALLKRLDSLEAKIDALFKATGASIQCVEDSEESNKKC